MSGVLLLTPFQVEEELARYSFKGVLSLLKPTFSVTVFSEAELALHIELHAPDRDTDKPISLYHVSYIHIDHVMKDKGGWRKGVQNHLHRQLVHFMKHEVDEGFVLDGKRVHDPH